MTLESLATIHPARPDRFADGSVHEVMRRLRNEAPIHQTKDSEFGSYWSLTKYKDIVEVEALPLLYSSEMERGGISLVDADFAGGEQAEQRAVETREAAVKRELRLPEPDGGRDGGGGKRELALAGAC